MEWHHCIPLFYGYIDYLDRFFELIGFDSELHFFLEFVFKFLEILSGFECLGKNYRQVHSRGYNYVHGGSNPQ